MRGPRAAILEFARGLLQSTAEKWRYLHGCRPEFCESHAFVSAVPLFRFAGPAGQLGPVVVLVVERRPYVPRGFWNANGFCVVCWLYQRAPVRAHGAGP